MIVIPSEYEESPDAIRWRFFTSLRSVQNDNRVIPSECEESPSKREQKEKSFSPRRVRSHEPGGAFCVGELPPSSLRDATSLHEGGFGHPHKASLREKAPSPRELSPTGD